MEASLVSVRESIEALEGEQVEAGDCAEDLLPAWIVKPRVEGLRVAESFMETCVQVLLDAADGLRPVVLFVGIGLHFGKGDGCGFEGDGHAVAGKGRDHAVGIAEA